MKMLRFLALLICLAVLWPSLADAANRFLTCTATCTITASDTTIWGTTTGGTGASVPGSSDAVVLDGATCVGGVTCTATMGAGYNPTWQSVTISVCTASTTGCILDFSVNNNSITLTATQGWIDTSTGTHTVLMGSGTWTLSGAGNVVWNVLNANATYTAGTSTLAFTGATGQMRPGSKTYNNVNFPAGRWNIGSTGGTFANLGLVPGTWLIVGSGLTYTISNAQAWAGTRAAPILITSDSNITNAALIMSAAGTTLDWGIIAAMTSTTNGSTATNTVGYGTNTGWTINSGPSSGGGGRCIGC